ncbi:hypothetical protein QWA68_015678 [Fusarium oxysporum]|nr:hypothetical protein QWA68_015678 [Fusarium oxysporum]
MLKRPLS